ncbi:MAG: hypothetical protein KBE16_00625 [Alphaproteobacteria bacterium]|jgi:uncharacterized membrane protein YhaH (DUF805 family)|nr:hypothetical protein [Alphaproteobacteria bacterium]MBP9876925.1 hypothetical protein [Alphaproteobacteria bacterium]
MSVLKTLFDFRSGELERIPYLLYSLVGFLVMLVSGTIFITYLPEGGSLMVLFGLLFALSIYVAFSLSVQRVRHIGLESPILLVLSFFALMTLALFVVPLDPVSQANNQLMSMTPYQLITYAVFLLWGIPGAFLEKRPFRVLFCEAKTGELRRLPYFGYLLFTSIFFGFLLHLITLPFQMLMMFFGSTFLLAIIGVFVMILLVIYWIASFYATAVLMIKRMHNIGFSRPILYFCLYMLYFFGVLGGFFLHLVMTVDFAALQETKDIAPLVPYFIWGGIWYLTVIIFSLFILFAPEGTLNSTKKLKK